MLRIERSKRTAANSDATAIRNVQYILRTEYRGRKRR